MGTRASLEFSQAWPITVEDLCKIIQPCQYFNSSQTVHISYRNSGFWYFLFHNVVLSFPFRFPQFKRITSEPGFFNLTATFRSDSDFPIPYVYSERKLQQCPNCLPNSTVVTQKSKMMIWLVSHCTTNSRREEYFKRLSKYIPIDIYGTCGNKTSCGREKRNAKCADDMINQYKFYFSGENAICKDYYTGMFILCYW